MLRALFICLLCGCASMFAQSGRAPCAIQRAAAAAPDVWLLCDRGDLFVSSDLGESWQARPLPAETKVRAISVLDGRRGFAAGDGGLLLATDDGAKTWRRVTLPVRENLTSIYVLGDLAWLTGWSGVILHSSDAGKTWQQQQTGVLQSLESVYFADAEHGWAAGWVGTIVRTTDGGRTWEKAQVPATTWSIDSICFRDLKNGWAAGFGGQLLRTRDGGLTWERQDQPVQSGLKWVAFDRTGRGWIAADNELLVSEDHGESWKVVRFEILVFFRQILPMRDSVWAVGQFEIFKQTGGGLKLSPLWQPARTGLQGG